MNQSQLSNALLAVYDAAYAPDRISEALDLVKTDTEAFGAIIYSRSLSESLHYQRDMGCSMYKLSAPILSEYNRRYVDGGPNDIDTMGLLKAHSLPGGQPIYDHDIYDMDGFEDLPQIRFLREVAGLGHRFVMNLSSDPALIASLIVNYGRDVPDIPDADILKVQMLSRHLTKALDIMRWGDGLRNKYNAVLGVLNKLDLGVAVSDRSGRIILANSYADALFSDKAGLSLSPDDRVRASSQDLTDAINAAVDALCRTANGEDGQTTFEFPIPRGTDRSPLLLICSPLRDAEMELEKHLSGCLLTLVDTDQSAKLRVEPFAQSYGLTPAETRVLPLLVNGLTTPEISEELGVARSTVETHVKSILAKTGSNGRVGLVWKTVQFAPPVL